MKSPFKRNMFLPLMSLLGFSGYSSAKHPNDTEIVLEPPRHTRSGGGNCRRNNPKNKARKNRRPEARFTRMLAFRTKYHIWNPKQLASEVD